MDASWVLVPLGPWNTTTKKHLPGCHPGGPRSQRSGEWFFQESEAALLDHLILRCT